MRPAVLLSFLILGVCTSVAGAQDPTFYSKDYYPRFRLVFYDEDWHDKLKDNRHDNGDPIPADLYLDGVKYSQVGVKHKGDASYTGKIRENMKILVDHFVKGQTVFGYDVITLDAGRQSSIFNEVAALYFLKDWADVPLANIANLDAGTPGKMKKLGVFTNTERVDGRFFESRFGSRGHRYEPNFVCKPFQYRGTDLDDYSRCYRTQNGDPDDAYHDVGNASIALENASNVTVKEMMDVYAETDACMRIIIGHRMAGGWDGLEDGNNYFLCEEERHESRIIPVPWDLDLTWQRVYDPLQIDDVPLRKLFLSSRQDLRAQTMVRHCLEGALAGTVIEDMLWQLKDQALEDLLGSPFDDFEREGDVDRAIQRIIDTAHNIRDTHNADSRFNRELPNITVFDPVPPAPVEGERVWISAEVSMLSSTVQEANLWSRVRGAFTPTPMFDDGAHYDGQAGDGVYGAALPFAPAGESQEYYVEVVPLNVGTAHIGFEPRQTEYRPLSVYIGVPAGGILVLNEVVSDNEDGDVDEAGDYDDWLEISNLSDNDYDLGEAWLSDDQLEPRKWQIPAGTTVPAQGSIRVWCDEEVDEGPLHANFRISKTGEKIRLTSSDATGNIVLDEVIVPELETDDAWGRVPDGGPYWFHVKRPSGGELVAEPGDENRYDVRKDGAESGFRLRIDGDLEVGEEMRFEFRDGPNNSLAFLYIGLDSDRIDVGDLGWFVVDLTTKAIITVPLNANGEFDLEFDVPDIAAGLRFHAQALALEADLSNGVIGVIE